MLGRERFGAGGILNPFKIGSGLELPPGFQAHLSNSLHLKMDDWKFSFWDGLFFRAYVSFRECNNPLIRPYFLGVWHWGGGTLRLPIIVKKWRWCFLKRRVFIMEKGTVSPCWYVYYGHRVLQFGEDEAILVELIQGGPLRSL